MRTQGSASELEKQRRLAVAAVHAGHGVLNVAAIFKVHRRTLSRWLNVERREGPKGLAAKPAKGRKPKLTAGQERLILGWFTRSPMEFGFPTELWTAPRVCQLIRREFGIHFHPRYLNLWLAKRRITPQKPARQPRERDPEKIARWLRDEWPRIQKKPSKNMPISS